MPDGLMFMVPTQIAPALLSPLFSPATKFRMVREWRSSPRQSNGDESVAALVERHYGAEMVDRLADPLLSGVYGGEAAQLSVRAVLPRFAEMEAKYGSLARGMLAAAQEAETIRRLDRVRYLLLSKVECSNCRKPLWRSFRRRPCTQTPPYRPSSGRTRLGRFRWIRVRSVRCGDRGHAGRLPPPLLLEIASARTGLRTQGDSV